MLKRPALPLLSTLPALQSLALLGLLAAALALRLALLLFDIAGTGLRRVAGRTGAASFCPCHGLVLRISRNPE